MKRIYEVRTPPDLEGQVKETILKAIPPERIILDKQTEDWMIKRSLGSNFKGDRKAKDFAKQLFLSWDDDGSGVLDSDEILQPLLALGLSSDMQFAEKLLSALDPSVGKPGHTELSIKLQDFIKIFKPDKTQEKIVEVVKREVIEM